MLCDKSRHRMSDYLFGRHVSSCEASSMLILLFLLVRTAAMINQSNDSTCFNAYRHRRAIIRCHTRPRERTAFQKYHLISAGSNSIQEIRRNRALNQGSQRDDADFITKMNDAEFVEQLLSSSLENVKGISHKIKKPFHCRGFPSVRQCNAAIATFGDAGDFPRALKLFTQMRKLASLFRRMKRIEAFTSTSFEANIMSDSINEKSLHIPRNESWTSEDLVVDPPEPSLVSYSTLMSRAVSLGKPRVAIRLWNLMKNQPNFYTNIISRKLRHGRISDASIFRDINELLKLEIEEAAILPDVIFCNTLMNAYAKLGDHTMARMILNSMVGSRTSGNVGLNQDIPPVVPTVVTYNTLADACKVAGELGAALEVLDLMSAHAKVTGKEPVVPDATTYTILISTVARKTKQRHVVRDVRSGGERDPDKAFELLNRMTSEGIIPNGVTYCALIDACSRCRRVDLALNGLRMMLRSKSLNRRPLLSEVGAWTAAINACGKAGRTDSAMRLFRTMQHFSVKPNAITCGCLADSLLKSSKITETLEVLKYMKEEGLVPGDVMYTSLMSSALSIAKRENRNIVTRDGLQVKIIDKLIPREMNEIMNKNPTSNSIILYTELMRCLIRKGSVQASNEYVGEDILLKVFLVFQEMKATGVKPDIACYNTLLRACTFARDFERTKSVLRRIEEDGLHPNSITWREALKAAAKTGNSDDVDEIWNHAISSRKKCIDGDTFIPRLTDIELLMNVYTKEIQKTSNHNERIILHKKIMNLYEYVSSQAGEHGLYHFSINDLAQNKNFMLKVLRAAVSFAMAPRKDDNRDFFNADDRSRARDLACEIADLDILKGNLLYSVDGKTKKSLALARQWLFTS